MRRISSFIVAELWSIQESGSSFCPSDFEISNGRSEKCFVPSVRLGSFRSWRKICGPCRCCVPLLNDGEALRRGGSFFAHPFGKDDIENLNTEWSDLLRSVHGREESPLVHATFATYRARSARARWEREQRKCCPLCKKFSCRGSTHRNKSRKGSRQFTSARRLITRPDGTSIWVGSKFPFSQVHTAGVRAWRSVVIYRLPARQKNKKTHLRKHSLQNLPPHSLFVDNAAMKLKYPNDRFDIRRKDVFFSDFAPASRKFYMPGAGMSSFEVHLRDKDHRTGVAERVGRTRRLHDQL